MKQDPTNQEIALRAALREWAAPVQLPPRFQEQVWQRIARDETQPGTSLWEAFREWVDAKLGRPAAAGTYLGVLLALGLTAGYWHARVDVAQTESELQAQYIQSVDPFLSSPR